MAQPPSFDGLSTQGPLQLASEEANVQIQYEILPQLTAGNVFMEKLCGYSPKMEALQACYNDYKDFHLGHKTMIGTLTVDYLLKDNKFSLLPCLSKWMNIYRTFFRVKSVINDI